LVPLEKVQTREQAVEKLVEFVSEFNHLRQLAVVYNTSENQPHGKLLLQRVREVFPDCPVTVSGLGASVASIFGPRSTGLIAFDMPDVTPEPSGREGESL
jgi:fatty acid-binding protein DegV